MDYSLTFSPNGRQVKYADQPFSIRLHTQINAHKIVFYCGNDQRVLISQPVELVDGCAEYTLPELAEGLYFFHFECDTDGGRLYTTPEKSVFSRIFAGEDRFLCVKNIYRSGFGLTGGSMYHVFVDRFKKQGSVPVRSDAVMLDDWANGTPEYSEKVGGFLRNNTFFGGTLMGVTQELDYIKSLGTEIIYLSPVFTAYSNHKYDVGDFMSVDSMFGGDDALAALIQKAHAMGMKIILDGVFNHVGDDSVYFDKYGKNPPNGAYYNKSSKYAEWFTFTKQGYDCWWGITNLPKINKTASYRAFICEQVIPKYMNMGIDGWRLDVVDEYDNAFLEQIVAATKRINPQAIVIGEVWDDATNKIAYDERKSYFYGASLDSVMNYPLRDALIAFIKTHDATKLKAVITSQNRYYPSEKQLHLMNFLGTHDTERIFTVLGGDDGAGLSGSALAHKRMSAEQRASARQDFIIAYSLLAALPGIPSVYYGDETGLEGYRDPFNRRPFPWQSLDRDLAAQVSEINHRRASDQALLYGEAMVLDTPAQVFACLRYTDKNRTMVVCNMSEHEYSQNGIRVKPHQILTYKLDGEYTKKGYI